MLDELFSLCENSEKPEEQVRKLLATHTREFLASSKERVMLVYPLNYKVLCWWAKLMVKSVKKKLGYYDPYTFFYFPWIYLSRVPLPTYAYECKILLLEEPFRNDADLLEELLRERISEKLKTVIFHTAYYQGSEYVTRMLEITNVTRHVTIEGGFDIWSKHL